MNQTNPKNQSRNSMDSINRKAPNISVTTGKKSPQSINLLTASQQSKAKKIFKRTLGFIFLVIVVLLISVAMRANSLSQKIFVGEKITFYSLLRDVIRGGGDNERLIGEDLGQINILLLGIGGEGHDGPYLTDTMILAQIRPDIGKATLTSIPRDYLVRLPDNSEQKINSAFSYGFFSKNRDWDEGGKWIRSVVEKMSGLSVPYFAVMDFSGFEKAIDKIGGVTIDVKNTFTDYSYPDDKLGYLPPLTFTKGIQTMDGDRALKFARSRHAEGLEGSDFARSLRQQQILDAFKEKTLGGNIISNASNINDLLSIFADHFHTNLRPSSIYRIFTLIKDKNLETLSLSLDPETGLVCPRILASNGAYVLVPCESEQSVKNYFKNSFAIGKLKDERSFIWLANSTSDPQIYETAFRKLTEAGLNVYELSYTKDNLAQTIVYPVSSKPATVEFSKNELNATEVNIPPPGVKPDASKVDVIIVLGKNAPKETAPPKYIPPPARVPTTTTSTLPNILPTTTPSSSSSSKKN